MLSLAALAGLLAVGASAHGFDDAVTPHKIHVMFADWGLNYQGLSGQAAAEKVHADIKSAIAMSPSFDSFCNGPDPDANKREAASFFANVRKETGGMAVFEEQVSDPNQYCTSSSVSGASAELKAAGENYPCAPGNKGYHGRGAIQLTWNINYGRFSEFMYGDKNVLLNNPEKVVGAGPLGWAATLWFWMTPQDYGGQCPPKQHTGYLQPGTESCHSAMQTGQGMGKTINIINGGYECCLQSPYRLSTIARMNSYMTYLGILEATKGHQSCVDGNFNFCDMSQGCPIISERGANGFPLLGTCTASTSNRWLGSTPVAVESWSCATTDPNPDGGVVVPTYTTVAPPVTTTKAPETVAPVPDPTTEETPSTSDVGGGSGGSGGCKSLVAHITDEWCAAVGCESSYPSICQAV